MSLLSTGSFENCEKNDRSLIILFLLILYILTFFPLISTGFTTKDDTEIALQFFNFHQISSNAQLQGRIGLFLASPLSLIPYIYQNEFYYQLIRLGAPIFLLSCLFVLLRTIYRNSIPSLLLVTLFLAFIQNSWEHNLVTSYPFVFNVIFCFLIISILFFIKYVETSNFYYGLSSAFFYFLSLSAELFILYFFIFILLSISHNKKIYQSRIVTREFFISLISMLLPIIFATLLYFIIYFLFRHFNPSTYDGNQIELADWTKMLRVVWQYSISSFPGYYFLYDIFSGKINLMSSPINSLYEIRVEWIVKAVIVFYMIFYILSKNKEKFDNRRLTIGLLVSILCIFVPNILLSLTGKYQHWVAVGSKSYVYTYYSFIGTVCSLSLISVLVTNHLIRFPKIRKLVTLFIAASAATVCLATDFHNFYTTQDQTLSQSKWRTIDRFLLTPEFQSLKNGSLIYAPSLFKYRGIVANHPLYWSQYISRKSGKTINVIEKIPASKPIINDIYFLKYEQEPNTDSQYLVFSPISNINEWYQTGLMQEPSITIFSYSKNKLLTIFGFLSNNRSSDLLGVPQKIFVNNALVGNSTESVFVQTVNQLKAIGDFISIKVHSESITLDPNRILVTYYTSPPQMKEFDLSLESGFHGWEWENENRKFSWTNGNAQINIRNSTTTLTKAKLIFSLGTLKLPGLVTLNTSEGLLASYDLAPGKDKDVETEIILKPGDNKLLFETNIPAELPNNGDTRKITFRISNFRIERIF